MAGLLAWAADVVAGNGNGSASPLEQEPSFSSSSSFRFRFSAEQQDLVRELDARAASLQQTIQHLRQRIPPLDISRRLPQLHADSLAVHSALTLELNAHQTTQEEAERREASLLAENASYASAIVTVKNRIQQKVQEQRQLESSLQELGKELSILNDKLAHIENVLETDQGTSQPAKVEGKENLNMTSSDKALKEGEELQRNRAELKMWEDRLAMLEQEWTTLLQNSTKWPSAAQREKELERRLRNLAEQLVSKQAQVDSLTKERRLLERQLHQANEMHRQFQSSDSDFNARRTKTTANWEFRSSTSSAGLRANLPEWRTNTHISFLQMVLMQILNTLQNIGIPSIHRSPQVSSNTIIRVLVVAYILSLHVIAFAVISLAS